MHINDHSVQLFNQIFDQWCVSNAIILLLEVWAKHCHLWKVVLLKEGPVGAGCVMDPIWFCVDVRNPPCLAAIYLSR